MKHIWNDNVEMSKPKAICTRAEKGEIERDEFILDMMDFSPFVELDGDKVIYQPDILAYTLYGPGGGSI